MSSQPATRRRPDERLSFADFAREKDLSEMQRRGFEMHMRQIASGPFNYKPRGDWEQALNSFQTMDRRRHSA